MSLLVLCIFGAFGLVVARRLPIQWYTPEWLSAGITIGFLSGTWLMAALSLVVPYRTSIPLSLIVLVVGIGFLWPWQRNGDALVPLGSRWLGWGFYASATTLFFSYLFYTHMLLPGPGGWYSAGPTWGDIAVHISLASHVAAQEKLAMNFPLYLGTNLSYPFLVDFLSGILYRGGWSMRLSLLIPGLLLVLSFAQLFFFMGMRVFKSAAVGVLAPLFFFLSGSSAGLGAFVKAWSGSGFSLSFLNNLATDYTYDSEGGLHIYNIVLSALLPQRSTLMGFSVFCLVVIMLHVATTRPESKKVLPYFSAFLIGLLPFAHAHTFLVGLALLGGFLAWQSVGAKKIDIISAQAFIIALIIAAPALVWQRAAIGSGFSQFHIGWMMVAGDNLIQFWWRNIGFALPVLLVIPWLRFITGFQRLLGGIALGTFAALNLVLFQPNPYDNSKLLVYCLLVANLFLAAGLVALVRRFRWGIFVAAPIIVALLFTGLLALIPEIKTSYVFLSNEDITFADAFRKAIPKDALVLTADNHNHPANTMGGRNIVMGYRGWLWTYGIDYKGREADISEIYSNGPESVSLLKKYGVSYVVVGPYERMAWGASTEAFSQRYPTTLTSGSYTVFKVD